MERCALAAAGDLQRRGAAGRSGAAVLRAAAGASELHNLYGPTEAAVDVTAWACERGATALRCRSAGRSPTPRIHLLDRELRPVPVGRRRASCTSAACRSARGYHGRPELTAERFVPDPFGEPERGSTGPATWRAIAAGRRDRVPGPPRPPGEDPRLPHRAGGDRGGARRASRGAATVVVAGAAEGGGSWRLVAYVVARPARSSTGRAARALLASSLPEYMVPVGLRGAGRCR